MYFYVYSVWSVTLSVMEKDLSHRCILKYTFLGHFSSKPLLTKRNLSNNFPVKQSVNKRFLKVATSTGGFCGCKCGCFWINSCGVHSKTALMQITPRQRTEFKGRNSFSTRNLYLSNLEFVARNRKTVICEIIFAQYLGNTSYRVVVTTSRILKILVFERVNFNIYISSMYSYFYLRQWITCCLKFQLYDHQAITYLKR